MKVAITGITGFIGQNLSAFLTANGHQVIALTRADFQLGVTAIAAKIAGTDAEVNLAGAPVVKRWSPSYKDEILLGRVSVSRMLAEAIINCPSEARPPVVLSASAIGIYDDEKVHNESSTHFGTGFLADVCRQWEAAIRPVVEAEVRLCIIRIGLVLGKNGGALPKLLPIFKAGLGGKLGNGRQGFSFIHIDDFCRAALFLLSRNESSGVYNFVSPHFTTNYGFTKALARVVKRPAWFAVPAFALKMLYGEGAVTLLGGQFVEPGRIVAEGFRFDYSDIQYALASIVRNP